MCTTYKMAATTKFTNKSITELPVFDENNKINFGKF